MIITFMGNDGSGKTTIAKSVTSMLKECGFKTTYKHEYEYAMLSIFFRVIGRERLSKSRRELLKEKKKTLAYQFWPLLVWLDTLLQFLFYKLFKRKEIVVLDRYAYDQYLSYLHLGNLTRLTKWLYLKFPKPDVTILLAVTPQVAFERKKNTHDYPIVFYERQTEEYLLLAKKLNIRVVRTDDPFPQTLRTIAELLLNNTRIGPKLTHRAIQNRVLFLIMKKYHVTLSSEMLQGHLERKQMFTRGVSALRKILDICNIGDYALVKTRDEHDFVGNDIDILVKPVDFIKVKDLMLKGDAPLIAVVDYDENRDEGKMDIFIEDSLKIDLHSYIGWRNLEFLGYEQLRPFIRSRSVFGSECKILDEKANSFLIFLTMFFEKGFLTLDEYSYFQANLQGAEACDFDELLRLPTYLHAWIQDLLRNPPESYPIFVPFGLLIRGYLFLLRSPEIRGKLSKRVIATIRDLSLMAFWRLRYRVNGRLPFEVHL